MRRPAPSTRSSDATTDRAKRSGQRAHARAQAARSRRSASACFAALVVATAAAGSARSAKGRLDGRASRRQRVDADAATAPARRSLRCANVRASAFRMALTCTLTVPLESFRSRQMSLFGLPCTRSFSTSVWRAVSPRARGSMYTPSPSGIAVASGMRDMLPSRTRRTASSNRAPSAVFE